MKSRAQIQSEWEQRRRNEWFASFGPCRQCGSSENLEVDHIDPSTKSPRIKTHHNLWSWSQELLDEELSKCQPLCRECHKIKHGKGHGQAAYNRGCRCDMCRSARREAMKRYRDKTRSRPYVPHLKRRISG